MTDRPTVASRPRSAMRIVLIGVAAVALLLGAAYAVLVQLFPPARLAALLAERASVATGRTIRIGGDLSIRLLPTLSIQARDVALANAPWGTSDDLMRARRVGFEVSLRELLGGRLRISGIDVQGADVWLETDGADRVNWRLAPHPSAGPGSSPLVSLKQFTATDLRITYRSAGREPRTLTAGTLTLDSSDSRSEIGADLELGPQHWRLDGQTAPVALLVGDAEWPFDVKLTTDGANLAAKGTMGAGAHAGRFEAKVAVRVDKLAALAQLVPAATAALPLPLEWSASLLRTPGAWQADAMQVRLAGQALNGSLSLHTDTAPAKLAGELTAAEIDLARWTRADARSPARPAASPWDATAPEFAPPDLAVTLAVKVGRLVIPGAPVLSALSARVVSTRGHLSVEGLTLDVAGGRLTGRATFGLQAPTRPRTELQLSAKSLSVKDLDALWGGGRHFDSGRFNLESRLTMSGRSPRALLASANGELLLTASDVALKGKAATLDRNILARLIQVMLPSAQPAGELVLKCAVFRLPLHDGVAAVDRSIAMETQQIGVAASGEVNFARHTVSLAFRPRVKRGLNVNPGSLVELMLLSGPLEAPELSINPKGVARQATQVGVAAATGGLSLLAPLLGLGADEASSACAQAARASPVSGGRATSTRRSR